jgi:hypothetical protein
MPSKRCIVVLFSGILLGIVLAFPLYALTLAECEAAIGAQPDGTSSALLPPPVGLDLPASQRTCEPEIGFCARRVEPGVAESRAGR